MDRRNGFAFVEVCRGGFVCVFLANVMGLPLSFFFLLADMGFVIVMVVDL